MLIPIKALSDNYIWLYSEVGQPALIVDPGSAQEVIDYCEKNDITLGAILLTHLHFDHVDGVPALKKHFPHIKVYGSSEVADKGADVIVIEGKLDLFGYDIDVISTPGHTEQHVSYVINNNVLFSGDTLFSAGCGRVFTGDYKAMYRSLMKLKALSDELLVCGAHEYTMSNIAFAQHLFPNNTVLAQYKAHCELLRNEDKPTLPSKLALEKAINPFLLAENLEQFIQWRQGKDNF